jgi:integrase
LVWGDVDHENGLLRFREQISRDDKTRKDMKTANAVRTFRIPPALEPYLGREARMKAMWSADNDFVFASGRARPKSYRNWRRALQSATEEAGLGHLVAHDLRHSVTSILLRHGDVVSVSKQMGHANPNVTLAVYAHVLGTEEEQADRGAEIAAAAGLGY